MKLTLEQKHKDIIAASGHVLVTGGPGSGKTTIALLKAQECCPALLPSQEVLFLSFSRAAVRQILTRCKDILTPAQRKLIQVRTYHSFCLEVLEAHGRLLCGRQVRFLFPSDERLAKSTFEGDWNVEQSRLSTTEGMFCFALVASATATLFEQCAAVRLLYTRKYPLVIVDEFQDTDDDQWRIIQSLTKATEVLCLADPDQRIFEYRGNVDPHRLDALREKIKPMEFDLGGDNHRSPTAGILQFADAILHNRAPLPDTPTVKTVHCYPNAFHSTVHAAVVWTFSKLRQDGIKRPTVAVLCRTNSFVALVSAILSEEHQYNTQTLRPIEHDVLWDADLSAAAAQVVGSILEWSVERAQAGVLYTLRLIAHYYRIKNAESPSKTSAENARKFTEAVAAIENGTPLRLKVAKVLTEVAAAGTPYVGDAVSDWRKARGVLKSVKALDELFGQARLIRLFRATDALGRGLSDLWLEAGRYVGAARLVKRILDQERLIAADRDPEGCVLMNMHKAKAKEFDGVVIVEGAFVSRLFDTDREKPPYQGSRRVLRVAITRARSLVTMVRPRGAEPLVRTYA